MTEYELLDIELDRLNDERSNALDNTKFVMDDTFFEVYDNVCEPYNKRISEVSRKMRAIQVPIFREIPDYADVMSIEEFKDSCLWGGFINSDGTGRYVKDGKESDIYIYPSDFKHNFVREDFDSVAWYNK